MAQTARSSSFNQRFPGGNPSITACSQASMLACASLYTCLGSSSTALSRTGSRGQQPSQRCPDSPHPRHLLQLLGEYSEVLPGQPRDGVSPVGPGSASGPPPGGTGLELLPREASGGHLKQPEPPQLTPLEAKEQRCLSNLGFRSGRSFLPSMCLQVSLPLTSWALKSPSRTVGSLVYPPALSSPPPPPRGLREGRGLCAAMVFMVSGPKIDFSRNGEQRERANREKMSNGEDVQQ